jgi:hypothetical protein
MLPLPWKLAMGAGLAVALFFAYKAWEHRLVEQGKQEQRSEAVVETNKRLDALEQDFRAKLAASEAREEKLAVLMEALGQSLAAKDRTIAALAQRRETVLRETAAVPVSDLVPAIRRELAVTPADSSPQLNEPEQRAVLGMVRELPLLREENRELAGKVALVEQKVGLQGQQLAEVRVQRDLAFGWADNVLAAYREAYNAVPKKKSAWTWLCLRLCGNPKILKSPGPDEFLVNRPAQKEKP